MAMATTMSREKGIIVQVPKYYLHTTFYRFAVVKGFTSFCQEVYKLNEMEEKGIELELSVWQHLYCLQLDELDSRCKLELSTKAKKARMSKAKADAGIFGDNDVQHNGVTLTKLWEGPVGGDMHDFLVVEFAEKCRISEEDDAPSTNISSVTPADTAIEQKAANDSAKVTHHREVLPMRMGIYNSDTPSEPTDTKSDMLGRDRTEKKKVMRVGREQRIERRELKILNGAENSIQYPTWYIVAMQQSDQKHAKDRRKARLRKKRAEDRMDREIESCFRSLETMPPTRVKKSQKKKPAYPMTHRHSLLDIYDD